MNRKQKDQAKQREAKRIKKGKTASRQENRNKQHINISIYRKIGREFDGSAIILEERNFFIDGEISKRIGDTMILKDFWTFGQLIEGPWCVLLSLRVVLQGSNFFFLRFFLDLVKQTDRQTIKQQSNKKERRETEEK